MEPICRAESIARIRYCTSFEVIQVLWNVTSKFLSTEGIVLLLFVKTGCFGGEFSGTWRRLDGIDTLSRMQEVLILNR